MKFTVSIVTTLLVLISDRDVRCQQDFPDQLAEETGTSITHSQPETSPTTYLKYGERKRGRNTPIAETTTKQVQIKLKNESRKREPREKDHKQKYEPKLTLYVNRPKYEHKPIHFEHKPKYNDPKPKQMYSELKQMYNNSEFYKRGQVFDDPKPYQMYNDPRKKHYERNQLYNDPKPRNEIRTRLPLTQQTTPKPKKLFNINRPPRRPQTTKIAPSTTTELPFRTNFPIEDYTGWVPIIPLVQPTHTTTVQPEPEIYTIGQSYSNRPVNYNTKSSPRPLRTIQYNHKQFYYVMPSVKRPKRRVDKPKITKKEIDSSSSFRDDSLAEESKKIETKIKYKTKIKHHHHHHHHKYIQTVIEKVNVPVKVPVKVYVDKPYPVEKKVPYPVEKIVHKIIEKKVPYPVEKKVPYPVEVKVPQPYPVKVIEKEYILKPYPVVKHIVRTVEVKVPYPQPYPVETKVPYPVEVKVPVYIEKKVPFPVEVETKVAYPVKVYVPKSHSTETKGKEKVEHSKPIPIPVKVKEEYLPFEHREIHKFPQVKAEEFHPFKHEEIHKFNIKTDEFPSVEPREIFKFPIQVKSEEFQPFEPRELHKKPVTFKADEFQRIEPSVLHKIPVKVYAENHKDLKKDSSYSFSSHFPIKSSIPIPVPVEKYATEMKVNSPKRFTKISSPVIVSFTLKDNGTVFHPSTFHPSI